MAAMPRHRKVKTYWGHRHLDITAPVQEPTPEGFGLTPDSVTAVREWQATRMRFVAIWGTISAFLAGTGIYWRWGSTGIVAAVLGLGWIPFCFIIAFFQTRFGTLPAEAQVAEFNRAKERWLRFGRPLSEHRRNVQPWIQLSGHGFERAVTRIFKGHGFDARKTRGSGDGGIDIEIFKKGELHAVVQCKRYKSPCGPAVVRELYGAMQHRGAPRAILVCLGGFTPGVEEFAKGKLITLIDSKALLRIRDGGLETLRAIL